MIAPDLKLLLAGVMVVVAVVLSLALHDLVRAALIVWLGDDSGRIRRRISMDPTEHFDLVGTLVVPFFTGVAPGFPWVGWSQEMVPVPGRFNRASPRTAAVLVLLAGLSVFALLGVAALLLQARLGDRTPTIPGLGPPFFVLARVNIGLLLFHLLPLPALDAFTALRGLLPDTARPFFQKVEKYRLVLLLIFVYAGSFVLGPPFDDALAQLVQWLL